MSIILDNYSILISCIITFDPEYSAFTSSPLKVLLVYKMNVDWVPSLGRLCSHSVFRDCGFS